MIDRFSGSYSPLPAPRSLLFALAAIALTGSFANGLWAEPAAKNRPNIVLIMADDLGYGELGCYGQKIIKTPNIDQLARDGIRFTDFYCGAPVCAPSRCVLMTGKHLGHAAIRNNRSVPNILPELRQKFGWDTAGQQPLPADEVTIAELPKAHGYLGDNSDLVASSKKTGGSQVTLSSVMPSDDECGCW